MDVTPAHAECFFPTSSLAASRLVGEASVYLTAAPVGVGAGEGVDVAHLGLWVLFPA